MKAILTVVLAATWLFAGQALAGGDSSTRENPFADKQVPESGTDPGFDIAAEFFGLFLKGYFFTGAYFATYQEVDFEDTGRRDYAGYWYRSSEPDPVAEKKHYKAIAQIFAETKAELGLNSPKAAPNKGPVRDPDALPGLDY